MAVRFSCDCGKKLKAADEFIGKKVICSKCGATVKVPDVDEAPAKKKRKSPFASAEEEPRPLFTTSKHKPTDSAEQAATSANIADQMLHQTTAKAEKASAADYGTPQPRKKEKPGKKKFDPKKLIGADVDVTGTAAYYTKLILPGAIIVLVFVFGIFYFMSSMVGGVDRPDLGQVSGFVTLDDTPLAGAHVTFVPKEATWNGDKKPANADGFTDDQGRFSLIYVKDVPGAAVGEYIVRIFHPQKRIPVIYNVKSVLGFTVEPGSNKEAAFQLRSK